MSDEHTSEQAAGNAWEEAFRGQAFDGNCSLRPGEQFLAILRAGEGDLFYAAINALAQAVGQRDEYTGDHSARVTEYSCLLGQQLDVPPEDLHWLRIGAPLHDIGKMGIDDSILRKRGRLTPAEFEIMKTHTTKGARIVEQIGCLAPVLSIVRSHHERWDGTGYPDGLAGQDIPRVARIVAVANAFDAMTSDTPYRPGMWSEHAFDEIKRMSGSQFDPEIASAFLEIRKRVVRQKYVDVKVPGCQPLER
jgi:putative nucleotidyltransferase with HDIG domain